MLKERIEKVINKSDCYDKVINCFFDIKHNSHILHLLNSKYSQHVALDILYKDIVDLTDRFVESYNGKYGKFSNFSDVKTVKSEPVIYLKSKLLILENERNSIKEGYLQQITDESIELIYSTIYKLVELQ